MNFGQNKILLLVSLLTFFNAFECGLCTPHIMERPYLAEIVKTYSSILQNALDNYNREVASNPAFQSEVNWNFIRLKFQAYYQSGLGGNRMGNIEGFMAWGEYGSHHRKMDNGLIDLTIKQFKHLDFSEVDFKTLGTVFH